jgi:PAN domain
MDYPSQFPGNKDITDIVAYSLQDCLQACSEMTDHGFASCAGATFLSEMDAFKVGNCYLKGSLGTSSSGSSNTYAFGKLL